MKAKSLLIIPMVLTLFSCNQETKSTKAPNVIEKQVNSKRLSIENDKEYAAKLARIGEILVNNPVGVTHAHDMFNRALEIDPQNNKALFYSAFTEILMAMKGSMNRGKSLLDDPKDYDAYIEHLTNKVKYPEFVDFVIGRDSQSKFKDYQDIKRFVQNEIVEAFENASTKLNKVNGDVNIILTQLKTENTELEYNCQDIVEDEYSYTNCELKEEMSSMEALPAETVTVDLNDVKILASGLKGYSTVFKLYTAYSIKGQKHLSNEIRVKELDLGRDLTDKELHRIVSRYDDYLTLEEDHKMGEIVQDLEKVVEAGMDLETLNNQFCDNDLRINNLVKAICFSQTAREDMQKSLDYLSGPQEIVIGKKVDGLDVKIMIDLPAYLNNPVQDLKTLIPTEYNEDGSTKYTVEPDLNGLFPNKDLLEKLNKLKSE